MHATKHTIVGIHVQDRVQHAGEVQAVLTEFGCNIRTRLGLHDVDENQCATAGIILLELVGEGKRIAALIAALGEIEGIDVKKMVFAHD